MGFSTHAQTKYTISGYVKDENTGEELIGATIFIQDSHTSGTITNAYGFYSMSIPEGSYTITAQFPGYQPEPINIDLNKNQTLDFTLLGNISELDEIIITTDYKNDNITKIHMGVEKITSKSIEKIPVFFGEKDILKTIQLMPGVQAAGEGNSGMYVRGGTADQNLLLLDEAVVYNASHLLGFFSVFNSDALKDVTLYKGTQPAEYGGRLSSVLDIKMQEGNNQNFVAEGGIGLISSRLKLEGPIKKNQGSFFISGRRTYADLFLKLSKDSTVNQSKLYFYDLNAKANYRINERNRILVSGYFGRDVLGFEDRVGVDWGNATGTIRWNHLINSKMFANTSLIFSNYDYDIHTEFGSTQGDIISSIQNYNLKQDFQYFKDLKNLFKFGLNTVYYDIVPGVITADGDNESNLPHNYAWENAAYFSHEYKPNDLLGIEYGIRLSSFSTLGPGEFFTYNSSGETIDSTFYDSGEFVKTYFSVEPRLSINYQINDESSVKAMYGRNTQNLHLISNSASGNPTDLWLPSSKNVKPQIANQISFGYFRNFHKNTYEFSTEIYFKDLQNQIDYRDGAELRFNESVESQLLFGTGRAYGAEFSLKKKHGRFNGWIGYTLSRTEKKIAGINNGEYYPAKQDRTHDVSIVGIYDLSEKISLSASWVYYTGNAVTFPSGKYEVADQVVNYYTERNGYRMPDYHRLDLGVTLEGKKTERFESSWNFSLYNAYGQENAYSITFEEDPDNPSKTQAIQTTLFRWVPSVTYNFKF